MVLGASTCQLSGVHTSNKCTEDQINHLEIPGAHFFLPWEEILRPRERMRTAEVTWLADLGLDMTGRVVKSLWLMQKGRARSMLLWPAGEGGTTAVPTCLLPWVLFFV